jgi:hypothetical protein
MGSGSWSSSFTEASSHQLASSTGVLSDVDVDEFVDSVDVVAFPRPPKRPAASSAANDEGLKRNHRLRKPTQKAVELDKDSV